MRGLLTGSYDYQDGEGDPEGASQARWLRNGIEIPGETLVHLVVPADFGATLTFEVTPRSSFGFPADTDEGVPVSVEVELQPAPPLYGSGGPGGIANLEPGDLGLWLRSDIGLMENEVGVPGVSAWTNRAAGSSDVSSISQTVLPQLVESTGPRNQPALRFAANSNLQFDRPAEEDLTAVVSFQTTSTDTSITWSDSPAILGVASSTESPEFRVGTRGGNAFFGIQGQPVQGVADISDGLPHVFAGTRTGNNLQIFSDGTASGIGSANSDAFLQPRWSLGSAWRTAGFWSGDLFEVAVFTRTLEPLELDFVTLYMGARQGIRPDTDLVHDHLISHPEDVFGLARRGLATVDDAIGSGLLRLSNPTALDEGDMLIASCDKSGSLRLLFPAPAPFRVRLERTWALTLTDGGAGDGVGLVDVGLYVGDIGLSRDPADYGLVLASDPSFFNATLLAGADDYDPETGTVEFRGVDLTGFSIISFALTGN